ncbi:MAG TPA: SusC/RagA family TonB-linked outer membrane protein [Chitinophagaceae bacterium]|nr:SusC/RagA family TonB-linked outer membrane protein [Chitinophagaceae bacterium]
MNSQNKTKSKIVTNVALLVLLQFFCFAVNAQVRFSGKVTANDGKGVSGISVVVKTTTYGTATDAEGNYSLTASLRPGSYTLEFSGVGFKMREETVNVTSADGTYTVNSTIAVDPLGLDEVVVTGTSQGTTRKQIGSYIGTVKGDDLNRGGSPNVLSALQGKTAGAQIIQNSGDPAGGVSVRLRGISSINSSSEPLYIVDGIIINNSTNRVTNTQNGYDGAAFVGTIGQNRALDINPDDIERVEVLNGAAAAAIYGSRANAGVVQIFTKKGTRGAPVISVSTGIIVSKLRKKLEVNQAPTKFGGPTDGPSAQTQDILTPALINTTPVTRYDYQDYIFRTALGTDNNISISGGNDKTRYFVSGSYYYNQGIVDNTDFRRFSFRSNLDQEISNKLSVSFGLNYINSAANEKPDGNSFFSPMNSVTIIGNFHNIFQRDANGQLQAVGERGRVNPVSVIEDFKQRQETNRLLASAALKFKPMKGLSFDYMLGIDNYAQNGNTFMPPFAYNVSTAFWGGGATLDPTLNGYASTANDVFFQINHELSGTYQFDITPKIGSTTQVGYSLQYEKNRYSLLQGRGLAPFIETVNGASTALPGIDDRSEFSVSGGYIQQNLRFNNRIFVTGAVRMDGSSVFGEDERRQLYYKASGSYLLSDESFWQNLGLEWWDVFKLRVAYGESGNLTGIGPYARFNAYTTGSFLSRTYFVSSSQLANENVKPERQKELEIGTDLAFLRNRIGLVFNWYKKRVDDLLISRQIAPTNGFSTLLDNFGSLENTGIELMLTAAPVKNQNFSWNLTAIFNQNRNKALKIGQSLTLLSTNGGAPVAILEGYPIGIFYGTFFALDANGDQIKNTTGFPQIEKGIQNNAFSYTPQRDANGLPVATATTLRRVIGDPNPDYTFTFTNMFTYKRFDLSVQFDAVQGVDVFNADFRTRQGVGNGKVAEDEHNGILPRGWVNSVYQIEEWRVDDGSFVKLRELAVRYHAGKLKGFKDLVFSLTGRNLLSWDNYKGYDPEVNAAGQSTILRGIDFGAVPIPATYAFSIGAKF